MAQAVTSASDEKKQRAPEWVYLFSDEQFVQWCKNHKLYVCSESGSSPRTSGPRSFDTRSASNW